MRILSWNINGIRTIPQYHPWNTLKTGEAILNELAADIVCFQEMKIQRTALEKHIAVPGMFDSFFSFPVSKGGYSGVAIYTATATVAPIKAEEGLTGNIQPKPPLTADERISPTYPQANQMYLFPDDNGDTPSTLAALDVEGRALVVDFGLFVLVNVYCPAETSETRLPYKMNFHLMLEDRVRKLIYEEGREVIIIGDMNVTAAPIDHCDGQLPSHQTDFWSHPPRAWFKQWLAPAGPMVDVIRNAWPNRKGMYTCWNTKISARDGNYGTRLDYILLTHGLLPWFKHGDIQASIRGSDHCPVYIDLYEEIRLESGETLKLQDAMKFEEAKQKLPPRLSARFWDEFSGKQRLLSNFFVKKVSGDVLTSSSALSSASSQTTVPLGHSSQTSVNDVSFSLADKPDETLTIESRGSSQDGLTTARSLSGSLETKSSSKKSKRVDDPTAGPKKKKQKVRQLTLSSFFAKPQPATSSQPQSPPTAIDVDTEDGMETRLTEEHTQMEADYEFAVSLAESSDSVVTRAPSASQKAWTHLLAPLQPPKCGVHGEPCKVFTVNKPGPNKGKAFFICSRPVGPGYDKGRSERLREEVDSRYRCDYFKWAREVKKASLKEPNNGANGCRKA